MGGGRSPSAESELVGPQLGRLGRGGARVRRGDFSTAPQDAALTAVCARAAREPPARGERGGGHRARRAGGKSAAKPRPRRRCSTRSWGAPRVRREDPRQHPLAARPWHMHGSSAHRGTTVRSRAATTRTHWPASAGRSSADRFRQTMNDKTRRRRRRRNPAGRRPAMTTAPPRRRPRWRAPGAPSLNFAWWYVHRRTRARATGDAPADGAVLVAGLPSPPRAGAVRLLPSASLRSSTRDRGGSRAGSPPPGPWRRHAAARAARLPDGHGGHVLAAVLADGERRVFGERRPRGKRNRRRRSVRRRGARQRPPRAPGCADEQTHALARGLGGLRRGDAGDAGVQSRVPDGPEPGGVPGVALGGERGVPFGAASSAVRVHALADRSRRSVTDAA